MESEMSVDDIMLEQLPSDLDGFRDARRVMLAETIPKYPISRRKGDLSSHIQALYLNDSACIMQSPNIYYGTLSL